MYAFLSLYFYQERSTFADNSYYLTEIIQHQTFCIQYGRYFAVLTQWLPLLAVKWHLPLQQIMWAFTISPLVLHVVVFLLIRWLTTEKWISYIYLFSILLTAHDAFFYTNDEMNQAAGLLITLIAILRSNKITGIRKLTALLILIVTLHIAHLFLLLVAAALLFLFYLEKRDKTAIAGCIVVGILLLLRIVVFKSGRDGASIDSLSVHFITFKNAYTSAFAQFVSKEIIQFYLPSIALLALFFYINPVRRIVGFATLFTLIVFYIVLFVFLRNGATDSYNDRYLAVLFLIGWSVLAMVIEDKKMNQPYIIVICIFVVFFSFFKLITEKRYTQKIQYLKQLMRKKPTKQLFIYEKMPEAIQGTYWSIPYETLLISSLDDETKTVFIQRQHYQIQQYLSDSTLFLGAEWTFGNPNTLDTTYFPLQPVVYQYASPTYNDFK